MTTEIVVPDEFTKVIKDFVGDLKITFPEYDSLINKWWKNKSTFDYIENEEERNKAIEESEATSTKMIFSFCQKKIPPRFFDILYKNEDIFQADYEGDTEFLPHIHFKSLWQFDISQSTKETIWKYLQLIMFSIVGSLNNSEAFGDSAKLFEAINQDEFKNKLEETLEQMQGIFDMSGNFAENMEGTENNTSFNMEDMPNANDIHDHITGMLDGKLGKLAKEIAEETADNLNMDMENATDMKDVFQKLLKNPTKLMSLVKTVGDKLDTRIKSGEFKESELIAEASEMMNKMKNMPGMGNIQSMLNKMGMGNLAGLGGKVNTSAMESELNKKMKTAQMKERMKAKAEANLKSKMEAEFLKTATTNQQAISEEEILKIFSTGEKVERTPRGTKPKQQEGQTQVASNSEGKKKKKNKK